LAASRFGALLFAVGVFALAAMPRPDAASGVTHTVTMDGTTFTVSVCDPALRFALVHIRWLPCRDAL